MKRSLVDAHDEVVDRARVRALKISNPAASTPVTMNEERSRYGCRIHRTMQRRLLRHGNSRLPRFDRLFVQGWRVAGNHPPELSFLNAGASLWGDCILPCKARCRGRKHSGRRKGIGWRRSPSVEEQSRTLRQIAEGSGRTRESAVSVRFQADNDLNWIIVVATLPREPSLDF